MMICITTAGTEADAKVDARFGRSPWFTFVDVSTGDFRVEANEFAEGAHGVGTRVSQYVVDHGAEAVITGQVGPNALEVLSAAGVAVYTTDEMTIPEALNALGEGQLPRSEAAGAGGRHR